MHSFKEKYYKKEFIIFVIAILILFISSFVSLLVTVDYIDLPPRIPVDYRPYALIAALPGLIGSSWFCYYVLTKKLIIRL